MVNHARTVKIASILLVIGSNIYLFGSEVSRFKQELHRRVSINLGQCGVGQPLALTTAISPLEQWLVL